MAAAALPLSERTLDRISIARPRYDRSKVRPGIIHLGVGGFHRAHQALYTDAVLESKAHDALTWGICGVGLLPIDAAMSKIMKQQDRLYTVWARGGCREDLRIIGCHCEYLFAPDDPGAVIERLAAHSTKVVTLTVTEKGYCSNLSTGALDTDLTCVQSDLAALRAGSARLATAPGFIVAAARQRRTTQAPPLAILSCDNVQANGQKCARSVLELAELACGKDLKEYIERSFSFPNSMVDRITPATTDDVKEALRQEHGLDDLWPVVCEDFIQWVIEDKFPAGCPPWSSVLDGTCLMVEDVLPYELMKLRLLNGSHQALGYPGVLAGYRFVHEAMQDKTVARFIDRYMEAMIAAVPEVPGVSLPAYCEKLRERFSNQAVKDQLLRLTEDGRNRIQVSCIPCLARVSDVKPVAALIASWIRYLAYQNDDKNQAFELSRDTALASLQPVAQSCWSKVDDPGRVAEFLQTAFPMQTSADEPCWDVSSAIVNNIVELLMLIKEHNIHAMLAAAV